MHIRMLLEFLEHRITVSASIFLSFYIRRELGVVHNLCKEGRAAHVTIYRDSEIVGKMIGSYPVNVHNSQVMVLNWKTDYV